MTDWYYHDPAQGRVGPHSALEIGARFRDRRIQRDTLVWNAGMREWQPLERMRVELDLVGVEPDRSAPPPLPPAPPPAQRNAHPRRNGATSRSHAGAPRSRGLSGCAIVAIVLAALAVPAVGILAAIAVPAYKNYSTRANLSAGLYGAAIGIGNAVEAHADASGHCPGNGDMAPVIERFTQLHPHSKLRFGSADGACAFEMTLGGLGRDLDGRTWLFVAYDGDNGTAWDCSGGDLPARLRPPVCRAE